MLISFWKLPLMTPSPASAQDLNEAMRIDNSRQRGADGEFTPVLTTPAVCIRQRGELLDQRFLEA
jgi:hypothetical protein